MYYIQCCNCKYCVDLGYGHQLGSRTIMRCTFYPLNSRKQLRAISNIKCCDKADNKPYIHREIRDYKKEM